MMTFAFVFSSAYARSIQVLLTTTINRAWCTARGQLTLFGELDSSGHLGVRLPASGFVERNILFFYCPLEFSAP